MSPRPTIGLLGGTFDPIHRGHLAAARAAQVALALDRVRFIPAARPAHRADPPLAPNAHRLEMVRRAVEEVPGWEVSDVELRRPGPSYTIDTLREMHEEGFRPTQIFFITGADAFAEIATWHRYPEVLDAAQFVVVSRPGTSLASLRRRVPALGERLIEPAGAGRPAGTATPRVILVTADTPDVSSTEVRRRASRGEALDDLVPPAVAAYIAQEGLYLTSAPSARQDADALRRTPSTGR